MFWPDPLEDIASQLDLLVQPLFLMRESAPVRWRQQQEDFVELQKSQRWELNLNISILNLKKKRGARFQKYE